MWETFLCGFESRPGQRETAPSGAVFIIPKNLVLTLYPHRGAAEPEALVVLARRLAQVAVD